YAAGALLFAFGYSAYCLILFLFFWSWNKFSQQDLDFTFSKVFIAFILFCVISALLSITGDGMSVSRFERGGIIGFVTSDYLVRYLSPTGAYIILLTLGAMTLVLTGEFLVSPLLFKLMDSLRSVLLCSRDGMLEWVERRKAKKLTKPQPRFKAIPAYNEKSRKGPSLKSPAEKDPGEEEYEEDGEDSPESLTASTAPSKPRIHITKSKEPEDTGASSRPNVVGEYTVPSLDLLSSPPQISTTRLQSDLEEGARTLENTLNDFNVSARVADIERGPVITRYELEPAPGVKIQRITTLSDDIALAMRAAAVRIVAPIPGKNRVGIEVPNSSTAAVFLKEVLQGSNFQKSKSKLMLAIGKDISGHPIVADLGDMPHLLIAGTTGAGKTVCVNSLIMSVLFNATPDEVKFLMVDPKMVELTQYNDIPHMLCPAVTDHKKVSPALNWVVGEMENRYQLLSKAGVRNIKAYHARGLNLPYIIIIIDELADLMQVSAKTVESAITRLAQLSRAVGIHLILATQRPSVDVITGVIKANFPARISFKVASKVDSRTVLDMNGAETLLGKGDMLFMKPGDAKPTRGQCSFVTDEEVHNVINFIKNQQSPTYDDTILTSQKSGGDADGENKDELYEEAVRLVIETNQASVSILQRRMRLGYTRAARLIDMMEQNGLVGPY
ncbi:MAG TPA: DNA translocase FtsK 4TM domain-containing protein, partial [Candidatus Omnitrophota bacterium]|nr:DNA translocase FtsK 4TM domain-containing protein [Candidatus Omnitrophota bacterium]